MADSPISRLFQGPAPQTVVVNTTNISAKQISVAFDTPNGNQPNTFGNSLWIWQSGNQVPWSSAGKSQPIGNNSPSGDASFVDLDVTTLSYLIGYAVGPKGDQNWMYPNVVASVYIPALGTAEAQGNEAQQQGDVFSPSVAMQTFGATSLVTKFDMLAGFNPEKALSYVGVWEGQTVSYSQPPKWYAPLTGSNSSGTVSFNNIQILRGTTYAIGLFASGYDASQANLKQSALAATSTFTV